MTIDDLDPEGPVTADQQFRTILTGWQEELAPGSRAELKRMRGGSKAEVGRK